MFKYNLRSPIVHQILLFLFVGGICYFFGIALLLLFVEITHFEVNFANFLASLITIFVCYLLNAKFVFKSGRYSRQKEVMAFFSFSIIGLFLNVVLMYVMTTYLPIWYVISKTLITIFIAVFNFIVRKKLIFLD
ncbi:GtrA family protein [Maribacter algarum]|uniref:GtrA family protein n=1 Tax=Maribacter algarum (ex Zhang et al. 2020) TaxID=2578118 RepID=A0A5S3QMJ9_9FLAO|nr:GtrA family protein [Maribacter algarum]